MQIILNYYPNYPTHRLYFGEVETPYTPKHFVFDFVYLGNCKCQLQSLLGHRKGFALLRNDWRNYAAILCEAQLEKYISISFQTEYNIIVAIVFLSILNKMDFQLVQIWILN